MRFMTGDYERLSHPKRWVRAAFNTTILLFQFLFYVIRSCVLPSTEGQLLESIEISGKHYPKFTLQLSDGTSITKTDFELALEDAVSASEARRILHRHYPQKIRVTYRRNAPQQCSCTYL